MDKNVQTMVSVVITTYQGVDTLERAIQSVIAQTYKNIELIVVDDNGRGSECQLLTQKLVESQAASIRYIAHETNINGSAARNTGIRAARGKYVALLDDDDAFRPEKISRQVEIMEACGGKSGLCYTGMMVHMPSGAERIQVQQDQGKLFRAVLQRKIHAPTSTFLVNREYALSLGGFDESFRRHQDWEFLDRMAAAHEIAVVPEVLMDRYIYKRNSAANPDKYAENRIFYLSKMAPYFDRLGVEEKRKVLKFHYQSIAKEYFKAKQFGKGLVYLKRTGTPVRSFIDLVKDAVNAKH